MLIHYTVVVLFNNAAFSTLARASGVCLCLIRLGQRSIVNEEDSAA